MEPKPRLPVEATQSEAAYEAWNRGVEAWGSRGWAAVARLCVWAKEHNPELPVNCSVPPPDS